MLNANIGIGPMSTEIIEAVFRYSHYHRKELMLVASKNQVDYSGGYVNGWTTDEYRQFIEEKKSEYPYSNVKICRDHCGPGFNGIDDMSDSYKTIEADLANGFDLIHIDFCHFSGSYEEKILEAKKAIEYCLNLNSNVMLEIGTDENVGSNFSINSLAEVEAELDTFLQFCEPEFYVVQTGSLIKEINQAGLFNRSFVEKAAKIIHERNVKLKEHNADYLSKEELLKRQGIVDAINIAPQLGVIQTQFVLNKCLIYGIDFSEFAERIYKGNKWRKWMHSNSPANKLLCSLIAGHYHFASDEYKKIIFQLSRLENIHESIINLITEVIDHYEGCQQTVGQRNLAGIKRPLLLQENLRESRSQDKLSVS